MRFGNYQERMYNNLLFHKMILIIKKGDTGQFVQKI